MEIINKQDGGFDIEGLTKNEAREFQRILSKFVNSYTAKDMNVSTKDWLCKQFKEEMPHLSDNECDMLSKETIESISEFDINLKSINDAVSKGISKESWFADKVTAASIGISVNQYGNYLSSIDNTIAMANSQMTRTITTNSGEISRCLNLDGYIAEQAHVNRFNMEATLKNSPFRAEVCVPESGQTYGLNSFDAVIKDTRTGKVVHQYQFKYGADADSTIKLLKDGNYNNQRIVVPIEQVDEVQKAFPGKTVEAYIGGTDKVILKSEGISKQQVKELQTNAQEEGILPKSDWNTYSTKSLAINLGKQAGLIGLQSAIITTGFDLAAKVMSDQQIDTDETIETALRSGTDAGIKAAVTGAMKVGSERGILSVIPKSTPIGVLANVTCVGIENVKILWKVAKGENTMVEALDKMGRNTISMTYGLGWSAAGMTTGAVALSWIPIVGPVIGGLAGGMVGYMAGSKFGSTVYEGSKKIIGTAKKIIKSAYEGIKNAGQKVKGLFSSIFG